MMRGVESGEKVGTEKERKAIYGLSSEGVCVCEGICLRVSGLHRNPGGSCSEQSDRKDVCFSSNTHY